MNHIFEEEHHLGWERLEEQRYKGRKPGAHITMQIITNFLNDSETLVATFLGAYEYDENTAYVFDVGGYDFWVYEPGPNFHTIKTAQEYNGLRVGGRGKK